MLYCNEATSVNCSEGWLLRGDDYYTLGSICTRLFFYCSYYNPSSLLSWCQTCCWTSAQHRGYLKTFWTWTCLLGTHQRLFNSRLWYPGWLCNTLVMPAWSVC